MKKIILVLLLTLMLTSFVDKKADYSFVNADKINKITFALNQNKTPVYKIFYNYKLVIKNFLTRNFTRRC